MELGISFWTCHDFNLSRGSNSTACVLHRTLLPLDPAGRHRLPLTRAPDEHESSPPEDAPLYPHSSGSHYQQNNHIHGQPYTGPAAHHLNNHQKTAQQQQENCEGNEEVSSSEMKDQ